MGQNHPSTLKLRKRSLEATLSIFTKIFIVLVMVLSILLAALSTVYVANVDSYKTKYNDEKAKRLTADANTAAAEGTLSAKLDAIQGKLEAAQGEVSRVKSIVNTKDREIERLSGDLISAQASGADVRGQLARLASALEQSQKLLGVVDAEVKQRRDEMLKLQTRNVELNDRVHELTTQGETLVRQVRLLKEQIADLETQNQQLVTNNVAGAGPKKVGDDAPVAVAAHAIRGTVTDVQKIGDTTFVALNVGTNDGVREGMKFLIHQGDKYLGDATVVKIDLNTAAARVVLSKAEITSGAEAMTGGF